MPLRILRIDHARIPADVLRIAHESAANDPDGQQFPWRDLYPLAGSTVYYDGQAWTVLDQERGSGVDRTTALVRLAGQGHDGLAVAPRNDLRPIAWSQDDERWLERAS